MALLLALGLFATGARAEAAPDELERHLAMDEDSAPVMLDGRVLFRLRGTALVPPGKRAAKVTERLGQFADDTSIPVEALQAEDDGELTRIVAGERAIMVLADLDTEGVPRRRLAEVLVADLRKAVQTYRDDRTPRVLLVHTGYAVLATLAAAAVLYGLVRLRRWAIARLRRRFAGGGAELKIQSMQLVQARQVWYAIRGLLNATITVSVLAIVYLHLSTVLGLYPGRGRWPTNSSSCSCTRCR